MRNKAKRIDEKGLYHGTAHVGPKSSTDGANHPFPFTVKVRPKHKGESDEEYEDFLAGFDLRQNTIRKMDKDAAAVTSAPPVQTPEEKAEKAAVKAAKKAVADQTLGIVAQSGLSAKQLQKVLADAGYAGPNAD